MYDAAVVGTGPAGLSAAVTLKVRDKNVLWFGPSAMSLKVERSEKIANYPGLGLITGKELNEKFAAHAAALGLKPEDRMVTMISPMGDRFMLLADNEVFEAKTVLLATGVAQTREFPGETELLGRGVSYCATCDGFLYKGKTIAVFCGAERYEHEVEYLAGLAEKVYLFTGYKGSALSLPNVEMPASPVKALKGEKRLEALELADGTVLEVSGFFCLRSAIAPNTLLPGLAVEKGHIVVDREMATSVPGLFAAGDCTGTPYQIAPAVGEGNVAAHSMLKYLASVKG